MNAGSKIAGLVVVLAGIATVALACAPIINSWLR